VNSLLSLHLASNRSKEFVSKALLYLSTLLVITFSNMAYSAVDIKIDADKRTVDINDIAFIQMIVTNNGNSQESDLTLRMQYPVGLSDIAEVLIVGPRAVSCDELSSTNTCSALEFLNFDIGTLNPGQAISINIPAPIANDLLSGDTITFEPVLSKDGTSIAEPELVLTVTSTNELTLAIDEDAEPVQAGDTLTYSVRYGNRASTSVADSELTFTLPAGVTFVSATGGGTQSGNTVTWDLGTLASGTIGQQKLRVLLDNNLPTGSLFGAEAMLTGIEQSNLVSIEQGASSTAFIRSSQPLSLKMNVSKQPSQAGDTVAFELEVENLSGSLISSGELVIRFPIGFNDLSESAVNGPLVTGSSCNSTGSSTTCNSLEFMVFNLGALAANQTESISFNANVASSLVDGSLIEFKAELFEDSGSLNRQTISIPIGDGTDPDGDGLGGVFDNCPAISNPGQEDADLDGEGDACDNDSDNDGMPDAYEIANGLDPANPNDALTDLDSDGLNNLDEFTVGTDPNNEDTDSDGILDGSDNSPLIDNPPIANAGVDITVADGVNVLLDASGSTDADGGTLSFIWTQTSGNEVTINNATSSIASFTSGSATETLSFEVSVTDSNDNAASDSVTTNVVVNQVPNADAGANQSDISVGQTVTLNGSNTTDDFDSIGDGLTLLWTETPDTGVMLSDNSVAMPTFTAPNLGESGGALTFTLTATDSAGLQATDTVIINVSPLNAPNASAGPDQSVFGNVTVTLNGSNSMDTDGSIVSYLWTQLSGESVTLDESEPSMPTFTSPTGPTSLSFNLTVTDNDGLMASDEVIVNVTSDPVAVCNAGPDAMIAELDDQGMASVVMVDGSNSTISSGTIASFMWSQLAGPNITFVDASQVNTSFVVPSVSADGASITLQLACTSDKGTVSNDEITITVSNTNLPPVASAGDDQNVSEGSPVTLSAQASADQDGDGIATYLWEVIASSLNSTITLDDASAVMPTFTAPDTDSITGESLTFRVTVTDGLGLMASDQVVVNVERINAAPTANAGEAQSVDENTVVTLDGSASTDPESGLLIYAWSQVSGSQVMLEDASMAITTFTAPQANSSSETLVFELSVTDDGTLVSTSQVSITVNDVPEAPVVDAGADQSVNENTSVSLSGSNTTDADNDIVSYLWQQTSGAAVTLSGEDAVNASFTAPEVAANTSLVFTLTVTDAQGLVGTDEITVVVVNVPDVAPTPPPSGGGGGGCTAGRPGTMDPTLLIFALLSGIWLARRKLGIVT
jgi:uncharacterized repeat protein (TIGR01451 family)